MKKIILAVFMINFIFSSAKALSDVELSGEVDFSAIGWNLPTGQRGNSAYSIPNFFLKLDVPLQENNILYFQVDGSEEKTSSSERFDLKLRTAYLDVVSVFEGSQGLKLGLIPQPWQELQYQVWPYRFLGSVAWGIAEKWKYLSYSDLGFSYRSELANEMGEWSFTMVNGEGPYEKEEGPRKDASVLIHFVPSASWALTLNYIYGAYEKYDSDFNKKERLQAMLSYQHGSDWQMGVEYLKAQDPADAIRVFQMAEGVTVTDLTGKSLVGQGGSAYLIVSTGPLAEVMLRYDYLNPVLDKSGRDIKTSMAALGYRVTEDIKLAFAVDYSEYGKDFTPGERDRSKIQAAAQVLF